MASGSFSITSPQFLIDCSALLSGDDEIVSVEVVPPSYSATQNAIFIMSAGACVAGSLGLVRGVSGEALVPTLTNAYGALVATTRNGVTLDISLTAVPKNQKLYWGEPNTAPAMTAPFPIIFGGQTA